MANVKPIRNEGDYARALKRFAIEAPSPIEVIKFRMDQMGLLPKDLIGVIGSSGRVSEVLNGRRPLSISMVRNLRKFLEIPADLLIQDGEATPAAKIAERRASYPKAKKPSA